MPAFYKRRFRGNRRRRPNVATKAMQQKPTAQNQKKQIYTLAKKVNYLQRQQLKQWNWVDWRYQAATSFNIGTSTINFAATPLVRPANWQKYFQDSSSTYNNDVQYLTSMNFNFTLSHANENQPANYWIFIVRPRFDVATRVTDQTTYLSILSPDIDYHHIAAPGSTEAYNGLRLNKSRYQILYARHYNLGKTIDSAATVTSTNKRDYVRKGMYKFRPKKPIKLDTSGDAIFSSMIYQDVEPWKQMYLVIATDDSNADAEYASISWLATFRTKST